MEILLFIGVLVLVFWICWKMKIPKCGNLILVTGGVKTGKTMLSVHMCIRILRKNRIKVFLWNHITRHIRRLLFRVNEPKKLRPELYSNIPLGVDYIPLSNELLNRKKNFIPLSVVYLCEASIIADSMSFRDDDLNERLMFFTKLIAHQLRGGSCILDTQSVDDLHFGYRRNVSSYFWIHHNLKLPFFCILWLREMKHTENGGTVNAFNEDVEDSLMFCVVPKKVWKLYDCYCYSSLTDDLPKVTKVVKPKKRRLGHRLDLKVRNGVVSFRKLKHVPVFQGGVDDEK